MVNNTQNMSRAGSSVGALEQRHLGGMNAVIEMCEGGDARRV